MTRFFIKSVIRSFIKKKKQSFKPDLRLLLQLFLASRSPPLKRSPQPPTSVTFTLSFSKPCGVFSRTGLRVNQSATHIQPYKTPMNVMVSRWSLPRARFRVLRHLLSRVFPHVSEDRRGREQGVDAALAGVLGVHGKRDAGAVPLGFREVMAGD